MEKIITTMRVVEVNSKIAETSMFNDTNQMINLENMEGDIKLEIYDEYYHRKKLHFEAGQLYDLVLTPHKPERKPDEQRERHGKSTEERVVVLEKRVEELVKSVWRLTNPYAVDLGGDVSGTSNIDYNLVSQDEDTPPPTKV